MATAAAGATTTTVDFSAITTIGQVPENRSFGSAASGLVTSQTRLLSPTNSNKQ